MVDELTKSPLDTHWAEAQQGKKIDLACGTNVREGYTPLDNMPLDVLINKTAKFEGVAPYQYDDYIQHDLFTLPWPFEDNSISATFNSHFVEHIPHYVPQWGFERDGWWVWFEELYRVMEDGGVCEFIHPFSRSDRAFWDPTHTRYVHAETWMYLNRKHRMDLGVNHYAPDIDFEILSIQTIREPLALEGKSNEVIKFSREFYFNITDDLFVALKVNK